MVDEIGRRAQWDAFDSTELMPFGLVLQDENSKPRKRTCLIDARIDNR
jgi:hypothetical protein